MRTRLVRTLSAGAVLVTAAGITIGSQGIGSTPVSASASSSSSPSTTPGTGSTASSAPTASTVVVSPVSGSTTQFSYVVGDAATLVLDSAGGTLRIVTFAPNPGWFTVRLEQPGATGLELRLESAAGRVRFAAALVNGAVVPELQVDANPAGSVPGNSAPAASAPGNSAPGNSTPGNTAPDNTGPDNTGPDNTGPGNTTPGGGDGDDDNSGPGGAGDDDSGGSSGSGGGDDNSGSGSGDD